MKGDTLTHTFDCKTPSCLGTARSRVGRYSYCDDCQKTRAAAKTNGGGSSFTERLTELRKLAAAADKAEAKAKRLTKQALEAKQVADVKREEFQAVARRLMGGETA